ncbi:MAG: glutamine amidotransferase [Nitrospinaceae bacterium]
MNPLTEFFGLSDYNEWDIHWAPDDAGIILAAWCLLTLAALWFCWTSLTRIRQRWKKVFLFGLRAVTFVLLMLLLLKPELEFKKSHPVKNSLAVLLDDSKSMSIKTFPAETERIGLVRKNVEANRDYLESLKKDFNVDYYFVSDHLESVPSTEWSPQYRASQVNTDFTKVFQELKKRYEEKPLQGILLFSDGADLTRGPDEIPISLVETLAGFQGPVHTFQAGTNESFKDLAIESLDVADFGFVHQPIQLSITVYASSLGNKNVPIVLKEGNNILVSKIVEVRKDRPRYQVNMQFVPNKTGKLIYTLSVPLFAGESIAGNNRRDFQIKIIRDRIRVLHLNGRPSWDSRFLREVLVNNPKVDLLSFFILRTLGDDVAAPTSELSLIPFPSNLLFRDYLSSFDLVIFQNFRFKPFIGKKLLTNLKSYVRKGGAFLMIGGELSFQGGGYERTPIEDILPVSLQRRSRPYVNEEFRPEPNRKLVLHPIQRLEKDEAVNLKIWKSLPPLDGINLGLVARPGAHVLLSTTRKKDGQGSHPVLVAGRSGKGRSVVLATDSSWGWNFHKVGEGGSGRYYQKFWNNLIAWLTKDPDTNLLQLETDKERYREGEEVLIKFKILNEDYHPSPGEKVRVIVRPLLGKPESHPLQSDENGDGGLQFLPEGEGFYSVRAEADRQGGKLAAEAVFGVFSETAEFEHPLVNETLMKTLAKVTGGIHAVLEGPVDLSQYQFNNPKIFVKTKSKSLSLWDNWWTYGLIVGFLFVDWWTRRKSGLS